MMRVPVLGIHCLILTGCGYLSSKTEGISLGIQSIEVFSLKDLRENVSFKSLLKDKHAESGVLWKCYVGSTRAESIVSLMIKNTKEQLCGIVK